MKRISKMIAMAMSACLIMQPLCLAYADETSETTETTETVLELNYTLDDVDYMDNDEALEGYLEQTLTEDTSVALMANWGDDYFEGDALILYNQLKTDVAKVAAGTVTSTVFSIDTTDMTGLTWTYDELGISPIDETAKEVIFGEISGRSGVG
ncbi:MAG: hypothetical protein LIO96_08145 [Lachnospiraceae bacterium]|nr:hypothetical protein [Lachnospiraceae bacterium]